MKQMKQWLAAVIVAGMTFVMGGCGGASPQAAEAIQSGKAMYTQVGMWYEQNRKGLNQVIGTNYNVGIFIPANTKVTMLRTVRNGVVVDVKGVEVQVLNVSKYTGLGDGAFVDRTLGATPVDLGRFSKSEREAIKKGTIVKGMSKDAVVLSRGYPPSHATPSLETDRWRYWKNRWATMYVNFQNGKVSGIEE